MSRFLWFTVYNYLRVRGASYDQPSR